MLREYYRWWLGQMLDLVPPRLREMFVGNSDALLIEPVAGTIDAPSAIALRLLKSRRYSELGRYGCDADGLSAAHRAAVIPGRRLSVRLRLPSELLLQKSISLPLGAERDLGRVLRYEMDRETPFAADEVWWNYAVNSRDKAHGKILTSLWLIPKAFLAPILAMLDEAGLTPTALEIAGGGGSVRTIPLGSGALSGGRWTTRATPLLAMACLALAIVAITLPFVRQSYEFSAASQRISELKPKVDEAETLRRRLTGGGASDVLKAERARVGDPLTVLAAATRLLPDNSYLSDFTMQQRRLTLNGQSVEPAKLIPLLAADSTFKDPALGTSTHAEGAHTDVFAITAEARP